MVSVLSLTPLVFQYAVVPCLRRGQEYTLHVGAENHLGKGPESSIVLATADTLSAPGVCRFLRTAHPPLPGSVGVTWDPPLDSGGEELSGYQVTISRFAQTALDVVKHTLVAQTPGMCPSPSVFFATNLGMGEVVTIAVQVGREVEIL